MSRLLQIMAQDSTARLVYLKDRNYHVLKGQPFIATITGNVIVPISISDALEMGWTRDDYEGVEKAIRNGCLKSKHYNDRIEYEYVDEAYFNWHLKIFFQNKRLDFLNLQKN